MFSFACSRTFWDAQTRFPLAGAAGVEMHGILRSTSGIDLLADLRRSGAGRFFGVGKSSAGEAVVPVAAQDQDDLAGFVELALDEETRACRRAFGRGEN